MYGYLNTITPQTYGLSTAYATKERTENLNRIKGETIINLSPLKPVEIKLGGYTLTISQKNNSPFLTATEVDQHNQSLLVTQGKLNYNKLYTVGSLNISKKGYIHLDGEYIAPEHLSFQVTGNNQVIVRILY